MYAATRLLSLASCEFTLLICPRQTFGHGFCNFATGTPDKAFGTTSISSFLIAEQSASIPAVAWAVMQPLQKQQVGHII